MSTLNPQLILEVTPFLATIVVQTATAGGEGKFDGEFRKQPEYDKIEETPASADNIRYTVLLSYHYEQSMRYFNIATIAAFVIFLTKVFTENNAGSLVIAAGVISVCFIIALQVWMRRYFESVTPTEYARKNKLYTYKGVTVRFGNLAVIIANLVPVVSLVFLAVI